MNSPRLRAAIIGLGVGEQHISGYRRHPAVEVTRLCDLDPAKAAMARQKYPEIAFSDQPEAVLSDPDIDIVSIASYDQAHHAQVMLALQHGKHVFVEKPLCLHPHEAREIRTALALRPELKLSSNLILRRCPRFIELKQQIQAGELGKIFYLEGDYNYGRLEKVTSGWRGQQDFYSVVHGGGVHLVDLMLWLLEDEVIEVSAMGNQIASEGSGFRFNDLVVSLLRFRSGVLAKMTVNFGCVQPHFHPLQIYGTAATFKNGLHSAELYTSRDPAIAPAAVTSAYPGTHKGELLYRFVESILGQAPQEVDADDVLRTMSVCFAIEQAVHACRTLSVDYI